MLIYWEIVSNIYLQPHNRAIANSIAGAVWNVFVSSQANKPPGQETKFSLFFKKKDKK